jgi:hypothetical protein
MSSTIAPFAAAPSSFPVQSNSSHAATQQVKMNVVMHFVLVRTWLYKGAVSLLAALRFGPSVQARQSGAGKSSGSAASLGVILSL